MYSEEIKRNVIDFYNKESENYSRKRYEGQLLTYTQFFFRKRLDITVSFLKSIIVQGKKYKLLEMACADGVVLRRLEKDFENVFLDLVGMDISPEMIKQAKNINKNRKTISRYFIKEEMPNSVFDLILGIGYISPVIIEDEFIFVTNNLENNGYYICSLPGRDSLQARFQLKGKEYAKTYVSYKQYEDIIKKYFYIVNSEPYGLYVPKIWSVSVVGRFFQPMLENIFKNIFPDLFHEKIYLLKKK